MVVSWAFNPTTNTATASGAGSTNFAALVAADTAGGWGKFTADATGTQIICAAKIVLGDGTNSITMVATNTQLIISSGIVSSDDGIIFLIKANANFTMGTLVDASTYTTSNGCSINILDTTYRSYILAVASGGVLNSYSSIFTAVGSPAARQYIGYLNDDCKIYNSLFNNFVFQPMYGGDLYNTYHTIGYQAFYGAEGAISFNKVSIQGFNYDATYSVGVYFAGAASMTLRNCYFANNSKLFRAHGITVDNFFINCNSDIWTSVWTTEGQTGKVFRQYEFSCYILDDAGSPIEDATVAMTDNADTELFSENTDGSGFITVQTVTHGYYDQAHGDTEQEAGPFTLTVTKAGYISYSCTFMLEKELTEFPITLHAQLTGTAEAGDVAAGETFYGADADTELTGTLALTGNADPEDVALSKTFYKDSLYTQLTGTYVEPPAPSQSVGVVTSEETENRRKLLHASLMLNAVHILQKQKSSQSQ